MQILEIIAAALNATSIDTTSATDTHSTVPSTMRAQDFAAYLVGLTRVQEDLIFCKYLQENQSCKKGIKSYRAYLYRQAEFMEWVKNQSSPNRLSHEYADIVMERTSTSPVLQLLAYEEVVGSNRCPTCLGAGRWNAPESGVAPFNCVECNGKGVIKESLSAQIRADRLHCSLSTYWRKWHEPYEAYYLKPLIRQETQALMTVSSNWSD